MHDNRASSYLFVISAKIIKDKGKDSENVATPLCLGNIWKDFSVDNMKKTRLYRYIYDFSIDYDAAVVNDILGILKYLIKRHDIK